MPRPDRPRVHREVVSYVRRSARMNASQEKAWTTLADDLVIRVPARELSTSVHPDAHVDWAATFGREAPLFVEIGSGRGEALVALAEQHPEANVVAFEVFQPAVASTLSRINRHGVTNVRVVLANGVEGLEHLFAPATVAELWTFFPDPWHKPRHHKRRLVSPEFAELVASRLVPGGQWRLATDWADYAEAMREVLDVAPGLVNVHGGWAPRWAERPLTKYEQRGLDAGREVHDLTYRRPDADADVPTVPDLLHREPRPGASGEVPL
ncbi:tRNA (guanosine(46)-N7)-methyltransferase TrmB [Propioniciclava sp. MC1683]|uniref:tRNA (guanosine(46)-N7)-methyltransferase TrmB n=1 Tax=Propioniciclava sp. MC1683 TaxID=2760309 RepID=UPI00281545E8|nr:tRNA (guanosine(46)-N7)-methyltransferase TrmB [Propioniciclava sp. MC1683]